MFLDATRGSKQLVTRLNRARSGHDDHIIAAERRLSETDLRGRILEVPGGELVWLLDRNSLLHACHRLHRVNHPFGTLPDHCDHRHLDATNRARRIPLSDDPPFDFLNLCISRATLHLDDHFGSSLLLVVVAMAYTTPPSPLIYTRSAVTPSPLDFDRPVQEYRRATKKAEDFSPAFPGARPA